MKPPQTHLDGRSLAAVLRDAKAPSPHENHALHWQVGDGPKADWAVRDGDWKLIGSSRDTSSNDGKTTRIENQLFNLRTDPSENTDLSAQHPDILARLSKLHAEYLLQP